MEVVGRGGGGLSAARTISKTTEDLTRPKSDLHSGIALRANTSFSSGVNLFQENSPWKSNDKKKKKKKKKNVHKPPVWNNNSTSTRAVGACKAHQTTFSMTVAVQ